MRPLAIVSGRIRFRSEMEQITELQAEQSELSGRVKLTKERQGEMKYWQATSALT
jgi:hypothetical protein